MQVLLLAPARLSCRPDLARLASEDGVRDALARIARVEAAGATPDRRAAARTDRVIEEHQVLDPALVPAVIWSGTLACDAAPVPPGATLRSAVARVTSHGIVLIQLAVDVTDQHALRRAEDALCLWVGAHIAALSGAIGAVVTRERLVHDGPTSCRDLRHDAFLWWHRLLVDPVTDELLAEFQLDRYAAVEVRRGVVLRIGDGYSELCGGDAAEAAGVLDGLALATQVWMTADLLQRRLTEQAGKLRLADSLEARARQRQEAAELYEEATLEMSVLLQTLRYAVGARRQAFDLAASAWNMSTQLEPLVQSAEALRQAVERRHEEARDARAARLGRVVTALAVISGLTVVLSLFETAVGDVLPGRLLSIRLLVSGIVTFAAFATLVLLLRRDE